MAPKTIYYSSHLQSVLTDFYSDKHAEVSYIYCMYYRADIFSVRSSIMDLLLQSNCFSCRSLNMCVNLPFVSQSEADEWIPFVYCWPPVVKVMNLPSRRGQYSNMCVPTVSLKSTVPWRIFTVGSFQFLSYFTSYSGFEETVH